MHPLTPSFAQGKAKDGTRSGVPWARDGGFSRRIAAACRLIRPFILRRARFCVSSPPFARTTRGARALP